MKFDQVAIGEHVQEIHTWDPTRQGNDAEIHYVDIGSIEPNRKIIQPKPPIPAKKAPSRARQIIRAGDILVSTVRPNLNAVAMVPAALDGATASTGFCVLRAREKELSSSYLFQWVKNPPFAAEMARRATGASYPAVSDRIILESRIPLPPIQEQHRIAKILERFDSLRGRRYEIKLRLDKLKRSLFFRLFGDPIANPRKFSKEPLGELLKVKSGEPLLVSQLGVKGKYPVYGGNGINGYHEQFMFEHPVIAIGRVGVYCGVVHITEPNAWVTDNSLFISEHRSDLNLEYLAEALRIANLNHYAGRAAQPLVSAGRIYPILILVPPVELQAEFAKQAAVVLEMQTKEWRMRAKLDALLNSLRYRAFRGEL